MFRIVEKIISATMVPIIIFNLFGAVVGAIWLLLLGHWRLVIGAFLASVLFPFAYGIVTIPFMLLQGLMLYLMEKNRKRTGVLVGLVANLGQTALHELWVIGGFVLAVSISESNGDNPIPYVLYFWEIVIGPFQYMASKEPPDSIGTFIGVYLLQISYLILIGFYLMHLLPLAIPLIVVIVIIVQVYLLRLAFQLDSLERDEWGS